MRTKIILMVAAFALSMPAFATPKIEHWQTAQGARVYFVENHDLPMLDVAVGFAAGNGYDSPQKSGLAGLTFNMLDLGVEGLSEDDIARQLADIGAQMGGTFDTDRAGVSLRTLSSAAERDKALDILARVIQRPVFPEAVLAREKTRLIASIKEADTKPENIADKTFTKAVFGNHPYGLRSSGEVSTIENIQRGDLESFYRKHFVAKAAIVAIMGDVTRAQAEAIALKLTEQLPTSDVTHRIAPVTVAIQPSEQRIAHPATQSHILVGVPGVARTDPDYFALYVGNHILGGSGFTSRLVNEIRENRGLAYSVYSYFIPMQQPGLFQMGLQTKKEQANDALQLLRVTLREFIDKGPTAKELVAAKQNIIGGFPLRIDNNKKIVEYLSLIGFYGLPLSYLDDFTSKIDKITVEQIRDAFKRHVNPDAMATVIVGAPEDNAHGITDQDVKKWGS